MVKDVGVNAESLPGRTLLYRTYKQGVTLPLAKG